MRRTATMMWLIPAILCHLTGAPAAPQQALQSDPRPEDLLARAIGRDAYGPVELVPQEGTLSLLVNGQSVPGGSGVIPVPPGGTVRLRAVSSSVGGATPPADAKPARLVRRTRHEELLWSCTGGSNLLPAEDGDVIFMPSEGQASPVQVTASVATLGVYRLNAGTFSPDETVPATLNSASASVWLLPGIPFDRTGDGLLDGQNIGIYPNESADNVPSSVRDRAELYRPPATFYRIDETTSPLLVTPWRTLGQLHPPAIATDSTAARYVPISDRLVSFLAAFEATLESRGLRANRLVVLRGFVSPTERLRLQAQGENMASFSRYLYGDGVALVYTESDQAVMGDFDGNGTKEVQDVQALGDIAKEVMDKLKIYGGLGICTRYPGEGAAKGQPYLHVDLRGFYAPFRE
ncbi:hypothetical protein GC173_18865 [bacterium]|nr:hypothetical protein [bacterium]